MIYKFKDNSILDLKDFKGEWTYQNIEKHFGKKIADKIMDETTERIKLDLCKSKILL